MSYATRSATPDGVLANDGTGRYSPRTFVAGLLVLKWSRTTVSYVFGTLSGFFFYSVKVGKQLMGVEISSYAKLSGCIRFTF